VNFDSHGQILYLGDDEPELFHRLDGRVRLERLPFPPHHYCFGLHPVGRLWSVSLVSPLTWELVAGSAVIVAFFALVGEGLWRVIRRVGKRAGLKEVTLVSIRDVTRGVWIVLAIVGVAFYTKIASDLTVLAVSTVGGLIVSLALQATLSNVIAGLFMLEDGTLRVGDVITYSGINGTVIRITLRTSWILTEKGVIVVVSNANLMGGPLTVHTATSRLVSRYRLQGLIPTPKTPETLPERADGGSAVPAGDKPSEQNTGKPSERRSRRAPARDPEGGEA
jgi:hypothetical protein